MYSEPVVATPPLRALIKVGFMAAIIAFVGWGAHRIGLAPTPLAVIAVCTFVTVICTTLLFWTHRVGRFPRRESSSARAP